MSRIEWLFGSYIERKDNVFFFATRLIKTERTPIRTSVAAEKKLP